jgi:hypothetical protein
MRLTGKVTWEDGRLACDNAVLSIREINDGAVAGVGTLTAPDLSGLHPGEFTFAADDGRSVGIIVLDIQTGNRRGPVCRVELNGGINEPGH